MCEWERNETELREQVELVGRAGRTAARVHYMEHKLCYGVQCTLHSLKLYFAS